MNRGKLALCKVILKLDRIPRYGRLYSFEFNPLTNRPKRDPVTRRLIKIKRWEWQSWGRWGFNILNNLGWLWPYLLHTNPGMDEHEEEECGFYSPETLTEPPDTSGT